MGGFYASRLVRVAVELLVVTSGSCCLSFFSVACSASLRICSVSGSILPL